MAIIKYRGGDGVVELLDVGALLGRVSGLEAKTASFERATSGIWKYEKRSDGTCVCEGQQTRTVNIENIYSGNIYYGDFAAVSFPSGLFTAVPDVAAPEQRGHERDVRRVPHVHRSAQMTA